MTSTVIRVTQAFLDSGTYETLSSRVDAVAMALLVVLLVEYEVLRVYFGPSARMRLRALQVVVPPLLVAFAVIVVVRTSGIR
jgi:hypothetical protein